MSARSLCRQPARVKSSRLMVPGARFGRSQGTSAARSRRLSGATMRLPAVTGFVLHYAIGRRTVALFCRLAIRRT
jgi:hypothetical protein